MHKSIYTALDSNITAKQQGISNNNCKAFTLHKYVYNKLHFQFIQPTAVNLT